MNNFRGGDARKRGNDFGGKARFGDKRGSSFGGGERRRSGGFGGGDRGGRERSSELFAATCSACSKPCEVPFRPNGEKPVFCSACYNMKSRDEDRGNAPREYGNQRDARPHKAPSFEKPYHEHRPSYEAAPQVAKNTDLIEMKRQLATIESRLNRILDLLNPPTPPTKAAKVAEVAVVADVSDEAPVKKVRKPKTVKEKAPAKKGAKKAAKKVTKKKAK